MPKPFAFSAIRLPTATAAALLPPFGTAVRTSFSVVEAEVNTLPSTERSWAYMWVLVRCTASRTFANSWIFRRVCEARRSLAAFLSIIAPLLLLGFLQDHPLVGIAHALALVRLGRPVGAHLGGDLSDLLLVQPLDHDFGLRWGLDLHAFRHGVHDGMRKAQRKVQLVALRLSAIADADQRQPLLETLCDTEHHVGGERPQRSRHGVRLVRVLERLEYQLVAVLLDADVAAQALRQRSERPLDGERLGRERRLDALRQGYGKFCDP